MAEIETIKMSNNFKCFTASTEFNQEMFSIKHSWTQSEKRKIDLRVESHEGEAKNNIGEYWKRSSESEEKGICLFNLVASSGKCAILREERYATE
jgi:hypothetical protein